MPGRFKRYFLRGLAVLVPTIVTIGIFVWGYKFIHEKIGVHIKHGLQYLIILAGGAEQELNKFWIDGALSIAGFLVALVTVLIVGALLASVVGRTLWRMIEKFIMNTPLLKQVYPYVKQITDFFLTQEEEKKKLFSRVVAVEYPRKGIWAMGFVTGSGIEETISDVKKEFLTILVPTSPTPFTGYVVMAPKEQVVELDITVEEALRFIISCGVVLPRGKPPIDLPKMIPQNEELSDYGGLRPDEQENFVAKNI
jgi:uncharacterized membrane protein